jgi:hypothetical protein
MEALKKRKEMAETSLQQAIEKQAKRNNESELNAAFSLFSEEDNSLHDIDLGGAQEHFNNLSEQQKQHFRFTTHSINGKDPVQKATLIHLVNEAKFNKETRQNNDDLKSMEILWNSKRRDSEQSFDASSDTDGSSYISSIGEEEEEETFINAAYLYKEPHNNIEMKLSEIEVLQAILLAEQASRSGKNEFKTTDQSLDVFSKVKLPDLMVEVRDATGTVTRVNISNKRIHKLKRSAKRLFVRTMKQAKVAKDLLGISQLAWSQQ